MPVKLWIEQEKDDVFWVHEIWHLMWYSHNEYSLTNNETQIFKTYSHQNMRPERLHPFHFTFPPNMHFLPFYEFCGLYQRFRAHLMLLSLHWPISFNYLIIVTMWVDQRELFQERFLCLCLHDLVLVQNIFLCQHHY